MTSLTFQEQLQTLSSIKNEPGAKFMSYVPSDYKSYSTKTPLIRSIGLFVLMVSLLGLAALLSRTLGQVFFNILGNDYFTEITAAIMAVGVLVLVGLIGYKLFNKWKPWLLAEDIDKTYNLIRDKHIQTAKRKAKKYIRSRCAEMGVDLLSIHKKRIEFNRLQRRYYSSWTCLLDAYS